MIKPTIIQAGNEVLIDTTTLSPMQKMVVAANGTPILKNSAWQAMDIHIAAHYGIAPTINALTGEPMPYRKAS